MAPPGAPAAAPTSRAIVRHRSVSPRLTVPRVPLPRFLFLITFSSAIVRFAFAGGGKSKAAVAAFGAGMGAGTAFESCQQEFKKK